MSTLHECDWCEELFEDRSRVASVDFTISNINKKLHICRDCSPEFLRSNFPPAKEESADN